MRHKSAFFVATLGLLLAAPESVAQDKPSPITGKLPAKAPCVVCSANGEEHGEEKPAAGMMYKGKAYYFCNKKEVAQFAQDPESFLPPALPRPAPAASLKTLSGTPASLASMKGKVVLVDFWATWCKPCVETMPELQKLHDKYSSKGFSVVGVSIDEKGARDVEPFLAKRKFTYPMLLDQAGNWQKWGVRAIPALFLLDKNGQIVRQWTGKADKKEVERAVAELVS
jgi:thiol-disulfide isomerase/thioredoxin